MPFARRLLAILYLIANKKPAQAGFLLMLDQHIFSQYKRLGQGAFSRCYIKYALENATRKWPLRRR